MPNHIHPITAPREATGLAVGLRRVHGRNAQPKLLSGHFWQHRFSPYQTQERNLWTALRYGEMNSARAGWRRI